MLNRNLNFNLNLLFYVITHMLETIYVPLVAIIAFDFNCPVSAIQQFTAIYLLFFAISSIIFGILSDYYGRRIFLIISHIIFITGCFLSSFSINIEMFLLSAIVCGAGAGCSGAYGRTIPRDLFQGEELTNAYAVISIATIFALATAPIIGININYYTMNWKNCFLIIGLISTISLILSYLLFDIQIEKTPSISLTNTKNNFIEIVSNYHFISNLVIGFIAMCHVVIFEVSIAIILQDTFNTSSSIYFAGPIITYAIGAYITKKLTIKFSYKKIISSVTMLQLIANTILLITITYFTNKYIFISIIGFNLFLSGITYPLATSNSFNHIARHVGFAGAILCFLQNFGFSISVIIMSLLPFNILLNLNIIFLVLNLTMLIITKIYRW